MVAALLLIWVEELLDNGSRLLKGTLPLEMGSVSRAWPLVDMESGS